MNIIPSPKFIVAIIQPIICIFHSVESMRYKKVIILQLHAWLFFLISYESTYTKRQLFANAYCFHKMKILFNGFFLAEPQ